MRRRATTNERLIECKARKDSKGPLLYQQVLNDEQRLQSREQNHLRRIRNKLQDISLHYAHDSDLYVASDKLLRQQLAEFETHLQDYNHLEALPQGFEKHEFPKTTNRLIIRRNELDAELISEAARETVGYDRYDAREQLLKSQESLRSNEVTHLQNLTDIHQKSIARLSAEHSVRNVQDECDLRRLVEDFKAHLGPYVEPGKFRYVSDLKRGEEAILQASTQNTSGSARRRKLVEEDPEEPRKKVKLNVPTKGSDLDQDVDIYIQCPSPRQHTDSQFQPAETSPIESRRRVDQIAAPHLDDSGIVYDVPAPRKGITDARFMSGGLSGRPLKGSNTSPLTMSTKNYENGVDATTVRLTGTPPSKNHTPTELAPSASHPRIGPHGAKNRSGGKEQDLVPESAEVRSGCLQHLKSCVLEPDSSDQNEDSPTQKTLRARRHSGAQAPVPLPREWGSSSEIRRNPTKISGPCPPKMKTILFEGPKQSHGCLHPGPNLDAAEDPFVDVNGKAKVQGSRSSSSSERLRKSTTPIPLPSIPDSLWISASKMKSNMPASSPRMQTLRIPRPSPRQGEKQRSKSVPEKASAIVPRRPRVEAPQNYLIALPATAADDRAALAEEKRRWRNMLGL